MRKFLWSLVLAAVVCQMVWIIPAGAQGGRGVLTGAVKDSGGSVLSSAQVMVQPLNRSTVTNDQGQFRISDLPAGEYEVSATYVGFAAFSEKVQVVAGQTVNVDAVLQVASQNDQVIVTAERVQGEAEAINIERLSDNIVQVLPERVIQSLPNTNIADAVGRLPSVSLERDEGEGKYVQIRGTEPRLSSVTINGVNVPSPEGTVREIKLDAVPSDLVERIEVFKTLSANQDADGIGGTVNLVTKTAGERPTYSLATQGGYNSIGNGYGRGNVDGTIGKRFGVEKKFGVLLSGTYDKTNRGIDDLEPSQTTGVDPATGKNVAYANGEDMRSYQYYRTRYGFAEGVDYNLSPGTNLFIKGLFSDFHDYGDTRVYTPNAGNLVAVNGSTFTFDNAGSYAYRHYVRRPDQQVYSVLAGARHDLSSTLITYEFAGSRSHNIGGQDFATTNFSGSSAKLALDQSDPYRPKFTALDGSNIFDPTQYQITNSSFTNYIATQLNFQGAASLARRYSVHSHFGTFEMGIKVRNSHSTQNEHDQTLGFTGTTPFFLSTLEGTYTNPTYYDRSFQVGGKAYGPTTDYRKIVQAVTGNPGQFTDNTVGDFTKSKSAFFDANEHVYAGYLQNVISIAKFRIETGIRFEGTSTGFQTNFLDFSQIQPDGTPKVTPLNQSSSYLNVLPSIQVQYLVGKNTNLRLNYSQGISRPNVGDLVPSTTVDPNASGGPAVTLGNSNLKPTKAHNYDILLEHFFQPLGVLRGAYFYKELSNPIYPTRSVIPAGQPNAGFFLFEPINGPSAHIQGFEAEWEQHFSFLPGLLNGFGVAANYGYTQSRVSFPATFNNGRVDNAPLPRQAPNTWNFNLTYDKRRFSMRFAISHNDANIASYQYKHVDVATDNDPITGLKGPTGDQYFYAHTQYDIQGSYRIHKGFQFVASGLNLSNEAFGFYNGSPQYPVQREYYKPTVSLGLRWTSAVE